MSGSSPRVLYLVRLWRFDMKDLRSIADVCDNVEDEYVIFAYYLLRYGKLRDLRWCEDIYEGDCVHFYIPLDDLVGDGYVYGVVSYAVRPKGVFGVVVPGWSESRGLISEGKVIDLTPEKYGDAFRAFAEVRKRCRDVICRVKEIVSNVKI